MECTRDNMECTNGMYARGTRIYMDARSGTYHQDRGGRAMCMFAWNAGVLTQPDVAIEDAAGAAPGQQQQGRPVPSSRGPVCLPSAATRSQSMLAFAFMFLFLSCFVCALGGGHASKIEEVRARGLRGRALELESCDRNYAIGKVKL